MGRPKLVDPPAKITIHLPESLRVRLELRFYSTIEGRVPHGAYSMFFKQAAERMLEELEKAPPPAPEAPADFPQEA